MPENTFVNIQVHSLPQAYIIYPGATTSRSHTTTALLYETPSEVLLDDDDENREHCSVLIHTQSQ